MDEIADATLNNAQNDLMDVASRLESHLQHVEDPDGRTVNVGDAVDSIKDAVASLERARDRDD